MALARALAPLEQAATSLAWNAERPWRPQTHLWIEQRVPVVDLHDLSIALALRAVETIAATPLEGGAVHLVTGKGRHNVDGRSRLREAVGERLDELAVAQGWAVRVPMVGRYTLLTDLDAAPPAAAGRLEPWFWIGLVGFLALACYAAPLAGIPLSVLAVLIWWLSRTRR
jgi:hypothetical protein